MVAALKLEIKTLKQDHKTEVQDLRDRLEREKEGRAADSEPLLDRICKLEERAKEDHKTMKDSSDRLKQVSISLYITLVITQDTLLAHSDATTTLAPHAPRQC